MGVDWRDTIYVEQKTIKRWKRVCENCGEEQFTTKIAYQTVECPDFNN